ncbi:MAG: MBOAT family protein [Candidatus Electrothrix sp. AX5]|nr:MBOAT family protein [Candidatus Electrothrix sp. AX5]
MVFSSSVFLFGFLPMIIACYCLSPQKYKNTILLFFSLFFYAWGEVFYIIVMIISIISNFFFGKLIYKNKNRIKVKNIYLFFGVAVNILLLIYFKYSNFIIDNVNNMLSIFNIENIEFPAVHLPLGISFFTFQAISYIVDVYRDEVPAQKSIFDLALYISLFPQLIAGPIVRYHDVSQQIMNRRHSVDLFSSGAQRFIYGLSKKMLIANPLGQVADSIFILSENELTLPLAWIGILSYSLQIFFDFSGYSDMAIGLGRMFGFQFHENFNYPYISKSLREFWRRWHISLSTWFRDYVYISLGGNRVSTIRTYTNLLIVFFLTGFWHGASWNFVIWGLFHGVFITLEHAGFSNLLKKMPAVIQHTYLLFVVITSWVFFRSDTFLESVKYLKALIDIYNYKITLFQLAQILSYEAIYAFIAGIILCFPVYSLMKQGAERISSEGLINVSFFIYVSKLLAITTLFFLSILKIASSVYNPFIYFRF